MAGSEPSGQRAQGRARGRRGQDRAPQVQGGEGSQLWEMGSGRRKQAHQPVPSTGRHMLGEVQGHDTQSQAQSWALRGDTRAGQDSVQGATGAAQCQHRGDTQPCAQCWNLSPPHSRGFREQEAVV